MSRRANGWRCGKAMLWIPLTHLAYGGSSLLQKVGVLPNVGNKLCQR